MDHVMFPRFWSEKPALWFAQVEAVFALNGITSDTDKYDYIITELSSDIICLLEDIILNPPGAEVNNKYVYLKKEVIKRLSIFELEKEKLGDRKPSEFLQHLRNKADKSVSQEKIRDIWLKSLPKHVQQIISGETTASTEMLSELADRVLNVIPTSVRPELAAYEEELLKLIKTFTLKLETMRLQFERFKEIVKRQEISSKTEDEMSTSESTQNQSHTPPILNYCWYHTNFGDKATKCVTPCVFKGSDGSEDFLNTTSF